MTWQPDLASPQLEELMEAKELPEGDRDELRRFAEVLQWKKANGQLPLLPPAAAYFKEWLLGEDANANS